MWSIVNFGKWRDKGKTLPQIIVSDPDWFFWALENGHFHGALKNESEKLARRAQSIKIPPSFAGQNCIQYMLTPDGKFAGFNIIRADQPAHLGSSSEIRRPFLSLRAARSINEYDKLGGKQLLNGLMHHWFSNKSFTKKAVEDFFDATSNFAEP